MMQQQKREKSSDLIFRVPLAAMSWLPVLLQIQPLHSPNGMQCLARLLPLGLQLGE